MGWTSFPMYRKPSLQELERLADEEFNGPNTTIIGRSSWTNWNTRRFTLFQHTSPERPGPNILIAVTLAEYRDRELFIRTMDETEGPLVYNCPLKLLKQAEQSPPQNEYSANWRAKVHKFHQRQRDLDKLLNQLFTQYPNGNRQLVVNGARSSTTRPAKRAGPYTPTRTPGPPPSTASTGTTSTSNRPSRSTQPKTQPQRSGRTAPPDPPPQHAGRKQ